MTLYLQEELFSFDHFDIWDENGAVRYCVDRELFTWGKTLHVTEPDGHEVAQVKHIPFSIPTTFEVTLAAQEFAVQRNFALFSRRYEVERFDWQISGDFTGHFYEFFRGDVRVAVLEKDWPALHDRYSLTVNDAADALPALCVVLAIDCCDEQNH